MTLFLQNLPTEPESPPKTAQHQGAQRQQEEGEEVQHPDDKVGGRARPTLPSCIPVPLPAALAGGSEPEVGSHQFWHRHQLTVCF